MPATAFLLAAGLGTRLRPLTLHTPKPLLPVQGRPLLDRVLDQVRAAGHDEVVVNAFHLADQIVAWAADKPGVTVVVESPSILGTGGGLRNAAHLLAERFVIVNGDILSDVDLRALWAVDAPAVMALRPQQPGVRHPRVWRDPNGEVTGIEGVAGSPPSGLALAALPDLHFTGVHALTKDALRFVPPEGESCIIRTAYRALIEQGAVRSVIHDGQWVDIGTLAEYEAVR